MPQVQICRWNELLAGPQVERLIEELDLVFFSSSAKQTFVSAEERTEFRERWLGRYLRHFPDYALLALDERHRVVGYVIGSVNDPARDPLFADIAVLQTFSVLTQRYPAQLHVNLDAAWRGQGVGARLVNAFADLARGAGAPGVHVVTVRGMRNVGFYLANEFLERGVTVIDGRELLFLGRDL